MTIQNGSAPSLQGTLSDLLLPRNPALPTSRIHLIDDQGVDTELTLETVADGAKRVAAGLQAHGVEPGDRVIVSLPTGKDVLETYFGVFLAGAVVVPVYPPRGGQDTGHSAMLAGLVSQVAPSAVVVSRGGAAVVQAALPTSDGPTRLEAGGFHRPESEWTPQSVDPASTALILFTSGSTGSPKGVVLSHRAFLASIDAMSSHSGHSPDDVCHIWMPLQHCAGIIYTFIALRAQMRLVMMSPMSAMLDPRRMLAAIDRFRATISIGFNSSYQLLANRITAEDLEGLELSCWREAGMGGEAVLPSTLSAVAERLAPSGFDPLALRGGYGMTEVSLGTTYPLPGQPWHIDRIDAAELETYGRAVPVKNDARSQSFVSVGVPFPGVEVRIVDAEGRALPDRVVGEIQMKGPGVMDGYFGDPETTAATFDQGWLRSGDLGYQADGELYVVGRLKDLVIKGARKFNPAELERQVAGVPQVIQGGIAAVGVSDPSIGTEALVLVIESPAAPELHAVMFTQVKQALWTGMNVSVDAVSFVPPGTLPRTGSGKLQRSRIRAAYQAGAFRASSFGRSSLNETPVQS